MDELLKKIYNEILIYEKNISAANSKSDKYAAGLLNTYKENISDSEYEILKDAVYNAVSNAQETGFYNGVRFTINILFTLLKQWRNI